MKPGLMTTNILLLTAEQIAAVARQLYPKRKVEVFSNVIPGNPFVMVVVCITGEVRRAMDIDDFDFAIQLMEEGVYAHNDKGDDMLSEWSNPQFEEQVAAGLTKLGSRYGLGPFPTTWMGGSRLCRTSTHTGRTTRTGRRIGERGIPRRS